MSTPNTPGARLALRNIVAAVGKPGLMLLVVLVIWQVLVGLLETPTYLLPAPTMIATELWADRDYLVRHIPPTFIASWVGFGIALVVGVLLAIPVALTKLGQQGVMPLLVATQSVPKSALAPLFIVWFGFGLLPKIVVAALLAFFPIVVNMDRGLRSIEPEMVQYVRTLGGSSIDTFIRLRLPNSLPYLFAAMKVSISTAWVGAIVGEFISADRGLGFVILRAVNNFDTVLIFAALVVVSILGVLSYGVVAVIERVVLSWQPDSETSVAGNT